MNLFRTLLVVIIIVVSSYTVVVVNEYGLNLFPTFFGDMAKMGWAGQFNLDFMCMLALSGLWVAWRHHFSGVGFLLGLLAFLGGAPFLSIYLLVAISQSKGDMREVLLGNRRVAG